MTPKIIALVPAAGSGARFGAALPKQYADISGLPLIYYTLKALLGVAKIDAVAVVLSPDDSHWQNYADIWHSLGERLITFDVGGATRSETVGNGLTAIAKRIQVQDDDWLLVHDAARPCITSHLIETFVAALAADPVGGLLALPINDTVKLVDAHGRVAKTVPREGLWRAQTPQMFRYRQLALALARCPAATDEAQAIESLGLQPMLVPGSNTNLKVTTPPDLDFARAVLSKENS